MKYIKLMLMVFAFLVSVYGCVNKYTATCDGKQRTIVHEETGITMRLPLYWERARRSVERAVGSDMVWTVDEYPDGELKTNIKVYIYTDQKFINLIKGLSRVPEDFRRYMVAHAKTPSDVSWSRIIKDGCVVGAKVLRRSSNGNYRTLSTYKIKYFRDVMAITSFTEREDIPSVYFDDFQKLFGEDESSTE